MGRSWRNFFRRSKEPPEETSTTAVEAPEEESPEVEELAAEPTNGAVETRDGVEEAPVVEESTEDVEVLVEDLPVERVEETVEPEPREPEPVQALETEDLEPTFVEGIPEYEEPEESRGWFGRLRNGLSRSRESFVGQLNAAVAEFKDAEDEEFWERIEEILITSDVGVPTTAKLVSELEQEALEKNITSGKELRELIIEHATRILGEPVELDISYKPTVILMVGVNGTGKTTNIGKLVSFLPGKAMLAAGDTFRAAAIEQLQSWGERTGAEVIARERGSDSASVAHDAVEAAKVSGADVLLIDTAGRLHTKANLMAELDKVKRVIERQLPGAPHEVLLTVDATTGQNGLRQAKLFYEVAGVTGIILTKLDGTAKGGIALAIANEVGVPIKLISVGEQIGDLHPFEAREFAQALFGDL